jgi:anti-sigma factor RsiW
MTDARDSDLELDMLSGYLDGELTGAERAAVEARLAESAEWRAELAEVQSARAIVRALGTREAPPDFWASVVAHVNALDDIAADLEQGDDVPAPVPITAARGRRAASRWSRLGWVAGAAAAVAALVVVVLLPNRNSVKPNVTAVVTQHGASTSDAGDPISGLAPVGPLAGLRR